MSWKKAWLKFASPSRLVAAAVAAHPQFRIEEIHLALDGQFVGVVM